MAYMDYKQFQAIMNENDFETSKAVQLYLDRAKHYQRMKRSVELVEQYDVGNQLGKLLPAPKLK